MLTPSQIKGRTAAGGESLTVPLPEARPRAAGRRPAYGTSRWAVDPAIPPDGSHFGTRLGPMPWTLCRFSIRGHFGVG